MQYFCKGAVNGRAGLIAAREVTKIKQNFPDELHPILDKMTAALEVALSTSVFRGGVHLETDQLQRVASKRRDPSVASMPPVYSEAVTGGDRAVIDNKQYCLITSLIAQLQAAARKIL